MGLVWPLYRISRILTVLYAVQSIDMHGMPFPQLRETGQPWLTVKGWLADQERSTGRPWPTLNGQCILFIYRSI